MILVEKLLTKRGIKTQNSLPISLRIRCLQCRRFAERRGHCEHERSVILFEDRKNGVISTGHMQHHFRENFQLEIGTRLQDMADDGLEDLFPFEVNNDEDSKNVDQYRSKLPRQFIRCASDDFMLRKLLAASDGKSERHLWSGELCEVWEEGENCGTYGKESIFNTNGDCNTEGISSTVLFTASKAELRD